MLNALEKDLVSQVIAIIYTIDKQLTPEETLSFLTLCREYDLPVKGRSYPILQVKEMLNLTEGSEIHQLLVKAMNADNVSHKSEIEFVDWLLGRIQTEDLSAEVRLRLDIITYDEYEKLK